MIHKCATSHKKREVVILPRIRDPNRDKAFGIYSSHNGEIDLIRIADKLKVSPGTVRGWKSKDKWDEKLNGTFRKNTERSKRKKEEKNEAVEEEVNSVMENTGLTAKQQLFCCIYIRCFNATKAYQKAYGVDHYTAMAAGPRMLGNVRVKKEIQKLKQARLNREFLDESDIFQKYMDIAFADITDYVQFGRENVPVMGPYGPIEVKDKETGKKKQLTKEVNVIKFRESSDVDGTLISEVKQGRDGASIKLADRMKALEWLSDHMDLATAEQRAKIAALKAKIPEDKEEKQDDGFIEALKGTMEDIWGK